METSRFVDLLELAFRQVRRRLVPIADAEGVSMTELNVVGRVWDRRKCRMTDVADDVGIPPTTLTGIIDRLVAKELLTRRPDPDDRRAVLLGMGKELPAFMERVRRAKREKLASVFGSLPSEHLDQLVVVLEEVLESLERKDAEQS